MTRLISGMLQISLGGALSFEPVMKFGDICTHVQRTVNEVAPIAEAKGLNLVLDVTAPPEPLLFEFCQMEQLLANLLDNACRLTPRGGRITVKGFPAFWERRLPHVTERLRHEERRSMAANGRSNNLRPPNCYRVEVSDTGPGLRNGKEQPVLEKAAARSARYGSVRAGLGLAICRQIISAHRGRLFTESSPKGATFAFVLPFTRAKAERAPHALPMTHAAPLPELRQQERKL